MVDASILRRFFCLLVALFSWVEKDTLLASALSASTAGDRGTLATTTTTTTTTTTIASTNSAQISKADVVKIANGGVAVLPEFVPSDLVRRMRIDAQQLKRKGAFRPDGLTNNALGNSNQQGFTQSSDRQTFRGNGSGSQQSWFQAELGDYNTRIEFDDLLASLRKQLAADLNRPSLLAADLEKNRQRHEITYNWYEPGAKLGRHLDEHHEETKGPKGWRYPSRRSVTWLVYLNEDWKDSEGGALKCHPRSGHDGSDDGSNNALACGPIGAHEGNLQVGWMDDHTPVYLDAFRESGGTALYSCKSAVAANAGNVSYERVYWSKRDFDVPAQPVDFSGFLPKTVRPRFEQISTAAKDPRFAAPSATVAAAASTTGETNALEVTPSGGTLVLFDSVTLPHSVLEVTGNRQRIAATGWFHEDSQFTFPV
jgi:Rps23 Pro-64 3,4-dihydroxylase Tpa1-like proline 4-hydroxylase